MFHKNRLLSLVGQGHIPLGIQMFSGSTAVIEVLGATGYDFVMIDLEHSLPNLGRIEEIIRIAELAGLIPYVRVSGALDENEIRRVLEAGAEGLFLPRIKSAADIDRVVAYAYMPPKGRRRICPAVRAAGYSAPDLDRYIEWSNAEIALAPIIETGEALDDIEAICAHPAVRMLYFAPGNLAVQLGLGARGTFGPEIKEAWRKVKEAAKRHDVLLIGGPMFATPDACRAAIDDGVRIFSLGLDVLGFRKFCEETVQAVKAGTEGTDLTRPPRTGKQAST